MTHLVIIGLFEFEGRPAECHSVDRFGDGDKYAMEWKRVTRNMYKGRDIGSSRSDLGSR